MIAFHRGYDLFGMWDSWSFRNYHRGPAHRRSLCGCVSQVLLLRIQGAPPFGLFLAVIPDRGAFPIVLGLWHGA